MSLAPGTRLGPYGVVARLGQGGMGEVYRARDTRLDRGVAVKVLPDALAGDAAFRQRLHTEARAISQLSHPNICTLHDIGEQGGTTFLVMELIEGETLAERLRRQGDRRLAIDEAVRIGVQIAQALSAAHRRGIVHRDLKPGNVMITRAGASGSGANEVKLLDFGLAKLAQPGTAQPGTARPDSSLPTTPPAAVTQQGTLLGTYQYMAPEQVEGAEADARSDIFALGCVLYEMLAGTVAFEGRSSAGIMAAILEREPVRLATRRADLPPLLVDTVEKCLAKNPDDRWQSAADAATALRWASAAGSGPDLEPTQASERSGRRLPQLIVGTLVALVSLAAGALLARQYLMPGAPPGAETRFEIAPPPDMMWTPAPVASTAQVALSPDGRRLAFVAADRRASPQIWIRELDSIQARPLAGTDDASFPFWSPDSRFVGFFAGGKLKTIEIAGGTPQAIADASLGRGGTWNQEGVIIYSQGSTSLRMWRVAAAGGSAAPLTPLPREQFATAQTWPAFLPDGRRFIYYQRSDKPEFQGIYASALGSSESKLVIRSDGLAMPAQGHVLVVREGSLFAHALDEATLEPRGTPVRIADGVGYSLGIIGYTPVSAAGRTLTYGPSIRVTTALQWRDRAGSLAGHEMARGVYRSPRLSSDGRQVAVSMLEGQSTSPEIWILDAVRGTATRITNDPASDWFPVWAPGVDRIFFGSARERATNIFQRHLIGTAPEDEQPLIDGVTGGARYPLDATGDGRLIFQSTDIGGYGLAVVGLEKERTPTVVLETQFNEVQARVSPNNRWIAYASDESGRFEVYVRGLPPAKGQWTISPSGGMQPEWSRSGRELFYISSDLKLMAVSVTEDASGFSAGVPRPLFDVDIPDAIAPFPGDYAVSADGQRFLVNTVVDQAKQPSLSVVMNWTAGLRR